MHKFLTRLFSSLLACFLKFCGNTNKLSTTRPDIFEENVENGKNIFAFWHSRLFYLVYFYTSRSPKRRTSILVSMSRDGDYGVALAEKLGQDYVRGSTSKGGPAAIRKLASQIAKGDNVAITPDGPRGPAFVANEGVIKLAQLTGAQIIPVSYQATRKRVFKSWDGFILVKPFGRVHLAFAEPIQVPRKLEAKELEAYRLQLQETLRGLDRICNENLGISGKDA